MEGTREERQQMRQRGAGTRKAKEVDFGFAFGSPLAQPPAPAPLAIVPENKPTQTQTAPVTIPNPSVSSQPFSPAPAVQRTPASARNKFPERPSTYDIPLDDDRGEHVRSNKRRKLSSRPDNEDITVESSGVQVESKEPPTDLISGTSDTDVRNKQRKHGDAHLQDLSPSTTETSIQDHHQGDGEPEANGVELATEPAISPVNEQLVQGEPLGDDLAQTAANEKDQAPSTVLKSPLPRDSPQPMQDESTSVSSAKRKSLQSPPEHEQQTRRKRTESLTIEQRHGTAAADPQRKSPAETVEHSHAPTVASPVREKSSEQRDQGTEEQNKSSEGPSRKANKLRGRAARKASAAQSPELPVDNTAAEPEVEPHTQPAIAQAETVSKAKRPRGRPSLGKSIADATETEQVPSEPEPDVTAVPLKARRGRPASDKPDTRPEPALEPEVEDTVPKPQRGRPSKKQKRAVEHEVPQEEDPEPQAEDPAAVSKPRRGRPGKTAKQAAILAPEPEAEATRDQPEPETESVAPNVQRGRSKKTKRRTEPEPIPAAPEPETVPEAEAEAEQPEHEPETEVDPEGESAREKPRRKTREPRGETVPVTVYRLANVNSMGDTEAAAEGAGGDQDSADELMSGQRTKIPNRGGVNPADVLSQICRETLDKTLNTLKDGIENEANATRRAEWSRKKKAVEIFASELDSRLMDLSGILDSNFVLGVQVKKTKREMMDLRGQLYRLRREREHVALQMDEVRSKHIEEEKSKTSRTAISNSLHSLELALERNQQRPAPADSSPADLEFMLRTVASISARAPGGQGGLLHQIRNFNAQLEATMGRLER
ncbi:hypothetical protein MYU51_008263 [Penicillium brevicompactum]|uniref:uncharacterized protein n=1 Tax=Penicillium brevicompactum TaxID=5074 RepID=UPI0025419D42|nr:uncharacterized protein N7506_010145 [Penicillium brevicompactum]KAJ5327043.1 hypothetical protein N7506_010145 [Penicillium brevicompactum]